MRTSPHDRRKTDGVGHVLRSPNVRWLYAGQLISQVGDGVSKVALLWFVYALTGSALKMTLIGVLQTLPPLLLGPFAGIVVDRVSKRTLMIVLDVARTILLAAIPTLYAWGLLNLVGLYVLVFAVAMFSVAFGPALSSTLPLMVEKKQLTKINALMQSAVTFGQLLGPALSGILITVIGAQNALYVNAAGFLMSALCKLPLRLPAAASKRRSRHSVVEALDELREGISFIFVRRRLLFLLMIIASIFSLGETAFVALLPLVGDRLLHVDPDTLGWLWSSLGFGIFASTLWLFWTKQPDVCPRILLIGAAAALGGAAILILPRMTSTVLVAGLIAAVGAGSGLITPLISATLQERTPQSLLGRVFGVFNTGTMAFAMLGLTLFGWAADAFGLTTALASIGIVKLTAAALSVMLLPWCRRLAATQPAGQTEEASGY
jgi:MFS family permease